MQRVTKSYKGLQRVKNFKKSNKGYQGVTEGYKGLVGVRKKLQGVPEVTRG